ncbi:uroporphyrinogen-III synthase [Paraliobacillus quinghaiensis]|uniref:Uroporphyrinogen-III synthase n=1 Tax=Paraliobacillus quinghaiensis TaxID=470815 RepID=A0A917WS99_9BACI|nr:uroporphyrinogen-III synthase [Paraliobacillus quinghaiensis]GGM27206.1 uroporphyrinogen-III synthase [Paraliobacillus quinghaiensis]
MNAPLQGRKILVTRTKEQAKMFIDQLKAVGAEVVHIPLLDFQLHLSDKNQQLLKRIQSYNWIFFTSANGVIYFFEQIVRYQIDLKQIKKIKFAVVGEKTMQVLGSYGYYADFYPNQYQGRVFAKEFLEQFGNVGKVLLVVGNRSPLEVKTLLEEHRVDIDYMIIYDTVENQSKQMQLINLIKNDTVEAYTFTSPSTIEAFNHQLKTVKSDLDNVKNTRLCVCIGTTTAESARESGFQHVINPSQFTTEQMIKELIEFYSKEREGDFK